MTITEARQLVAQFKSNGAEIGLINLEIKKLAEQGRTIYQHDERIDSTQFANLERHFWANGFETRIEERAHPRGLNLYTLVIDWS
jgi:hypothetical protein